MCMVEPYCYHCATINGGKHNDIDQEGNTFRVQGCHASRAQAEEASPWYQKETQRQKDPHPTRTGGGPLIRISNPLERFFKQFQHLTTPATLTTKSVNRNTIRAPRPIKILQREGFLMSKVEEKPDPEVALAGVLEQKRKIAEVKMDVLSKEEAIQAEEDALHHALSVGLVAGLFGAFAEFAAMFTEGVVYEAYQSIQAHVDKVRQHDPAFPRTLAEARYDVDTEHFDFWLNMLQKHIALGEPLEKLLRGIYGTKTHGTPFQAD